MAQRQVSRRAARLVIVLPGSNEELKMVEMLKTRPCLEEDDVECSLEDMPEGIEGGHEPP